MLDDAVAEPKRYEGGIEGFAKRRINEIIRKVRLDIRR